LGEYVNNLLPQEISMEMAASKAQQRAPAKKTELKREHSLPFSGLRARATSATGKSFGAAVRGASKSAARSKK